MSGRKSSLSFTPLARRDINSILIYTRDRWGAQQRDRYRDHLQRSFEELRTFPHVGPARPDIFADCRVLRVRQHVVYYRVRSDSVRILRILHASQDALTSLADFIDLA